MSVHYGIQFMSLVGIHSNKLASVSIAMHEITGKIKSKQKELSDLDSQLFKLSEERRGLETEFSTLLNTQPYKAVEAYHACTGRYPHEDNRV